MTVEAAAGCLVGQAVGDALGLPREGLSRRRGERLYPHLSRHQLVFRRGLVSDDTEHACMVAQALLASGGDPARFARSLAWRLRWWLAGGPPGVGKATLKACLRLWLGFPPSRSGVYSAGNGPAMRAAVLGVCLGPDIEKLGTFLRTSTRITHTDPKAEYGAFAVAWAAHHSAKSRGGPAPSARAFVEDLRRSLKLDVASGLLVESLDAMVLSVEAGESTLAFADSLDLERGVSGYIYHTVPVALHAWLRHPDDYAAAVQAAIRCGGDTDTVAAIVGGIVGARVGVEGVPPELRRGVIEWPRTMGWIERLGRRVGEGRWLTERQKAQRLAWWAVPVRNVLFLGVILVHIARRFLPPY